MTAQQPSWLHRVHVAQGFPYSNTDTAPTAVFLALFFLTAMTNFFLLFHNKKNGKLFVFNGLGGGFCMARVLTCSLRLAWIYNLQMQGLAIAATIFVAAGVLILFIINLVFSQRLLRGMHPHLGWQRWIHWVFVVLYSLIPALLIMVITATIQLFKTTNPHTAKIDINIQRAAATYFFFVSLLPIPITLFALFKPNTKSTVDHFGTGSFVTKAIPLLTASVLLTLGAGFRMGTAYITWNPAYNTGALAAPWWNAKWCFYVFNFGVELAVVLLYLAVRKDRLFWVPNKSKGPGSYTARLRETTSKADDEEARGEPQESHSPNAASRMSGETAVPTSPVNVDMEKL